MSALGGPSRMPSVYRHCDLPGRVGLAYLEQGQGEALLLIPGFTGAARRELVIWVLS